MTVSVLFVCMGNICRSPLAEAAFRAEAARIGLEVEIDSAGTGGWHQGEAPDPRAQDVAQAHGVDVRHLRARQVTRADFTRFTHIVAMDADNLAALRAMQPRGATAEVSLLLDHAGRPGACVADPYYGGAAQFERTWEDAVEGAAGLARRLAGYAARSQ